MLIWFFFLMDAAKRFWILLFRWLLGSLEFSWVKTIFSDLLQFLNGNSLVSCKSLAGTEIFTLYYFSGGVVIVYKRKVKLLYGKVSPAISFTLFLPSGIFCLRKLWNIVLKSVSRQLFCLQMMLPVCWWSSKFASIDDALKQPFTVSILCLLPNIVSIHG